MKLLLTIAALISAITASSIRDQWLAYKQTYGKIYESLIEDEMRFQIFQNNVKTIEEHNEKFDRGESRYSMTINQFADISEDEFKKKMNLQLSKKPKLDETPVEFFENSTLPESIDWREMNAVSRVKNQGACHSSWAFSATGAIEGQNAILNNKRVALSEQQLIDCSDPWGNRNCENGGLYPAYRYITDKGIESEKSYRYVGRLRTCRHFAWRNVLKISGFMPITRTEAQLEQAVATVGPIAVTIDAGALQLYDSGILDSNCGRNINHAALVVGYGIEDHTEYWILKNSWGKRFGERGYFRIKKNADNLCGIASDPSYPILNQ